MLWGRRALAEHRSGRKRGDKRFIAVNCGALAENLVEAELFGHERGAFTGAVQKRDGRFKAADGGTLLLDEVAELPLPPQAKLLRVLQEGVVEPLAPTRPCGSTCALSRPPTATCLNAPGPERSAKICSIASTSLSCSAYLA